MKLLISTSISLAVILARMMMLMIPARQSSIENGMSNTVMPSSKVLDMFGTDVARPEVLRSAAQIDAWFAASAKLSMMARMKSPY